MNDLLSRSELIEEIKSLSIVLNGKQIFSDDAKDTVLRIIKEQPTAYSVEKVVKELNKLDVKAIKRYKGGTFGDYEGTDYYIKKSDAIEIVKAGGKNE